MAIDKLQEKIRKLKNPSALSFSLICDKIPEKFRNENIARAGEKYYSELLVALSGEIPAVRFSLGGFALCPEGLAVLKNLTAKAKELGFYVLLDGPEMYTAAQAESYCALLCGENSPVSFDGILLSSFAGGDILKPFIARAEKGEKDVFAVIRTSNKTAPQLQDLLTGGRLVHTAAADIVSRMGESILTRSGYSPVGAVASATAPDSLRNLRAKYKHLFLIADGYDVPGANAKNCAAAFDGLGHGALICSALPADLGEDYADGVQEYVRRIGHNLSRHINVF